MLIFKKQQKVNICLSNSYYKWFYPVEDIVWVRCTSVRAESAPCWYAQVALSRVPFQTLECLQVTLELCFSCLFTLSYIHVTFNF